MPDSDDEEHDKWALVQFDPQGPNPSETHIEAETVTTPVARLFKKATHKTPPGILKAPIGNALKDYRLVSIHGDNLKAVENETHAFETALAKLQESYLNLSVTQS